MHFAFIPQFPLSDRTQPLAGHPRSSPSPSPFPISCLGFGPAPLPLAQAQPCRAPSPETALSSPPFWYPSRPLYHLLTQLRLLLLGSLWYKRTPSACCLLCCCCGTGIGSLHSVLLQLMKGNLVLGRDSMVSRIVRLGLGVIAFGNGVH